MLHGLSPSTSTSLAIDALSGTTMEDRGDHLIVRTPDNPAYHWGNFVQVTTGDPDDAVRWLKVFATEFPDATHRAVGLPHRPESNHWMDAGLAIEAEESLTSRTAPAATPTPTGYTVRQLVADADWGLRLEAELSENDRTGEYPRDYHRAFLQLQMAARRELVARGQAAWLGAFTTDDRLAASLGIVDLGRAARYQFVLTAPEHRRHGLARHLLSLAGQWAVDRGARELVIVAEAGSDAGRLYARAGFTAGRVGYGAYAAQAPQAECAFRHAY